MTWGIVTLIVSGAAFGAGAFGVRSGRAVGLWSVVVALSGVGLAAGALLVQDEPDPSSWIVALPAGAAIAVVHTRVLFAMGGPFRT